MYPLVLPTMAPFGMKITNNLDQTPFITTIVNTIGFCISISNQMKLKHAAALFTYTLCAYAHTSSL